MCCILSEKAVPHAGISSVWVFVQTSSGGPQQERRCSALQDVLLMTCPLIHVPVHEWWFPRFFFMPEHHYCKKWLSSLQQNLFIFVSLLRASSTCWWQLLMWLHSYFYFIKKLWVSCPLTKILCKDIDSGGWKCVLKYGKKLNNSQY